VTAQSLRQADNIGPLVFKYPNGPLLLQWRTWFNFISG
jgi:hypothetical protein